MANLLPEFQKRGVKLIALSCDGVESHKGWITDIKHISKYEGEFPYPIIADEGRNLAVKLGMIDPDEKDAQGLPLTARAVSFTYSAKFYMDCPAPPLLPHPSGPNPYIYHFF